MISNDIAMQVLNEALKTGGDFAEIYAEDKKSLSLSMADNALENAVSGRSHGVGIRVFKETNSVYVYTNDSSLNGLLDAARQAAAAIEGTKSLGIDIVLKHNVVETAHPILIPPHTVDMKQKVDIVKRAYSTASGYDSLIKQTAVSYAESQNHVQIINSEGLNKEDERVLTRLAISAVASDGKENQTGYESPGAQMGFEFYRDKMDIEAHATEASRTAMTMLKAPPCPAGKMTVAIESGFGGVIFHEACGHSLEATSVARGQSVFCGKMGQKIASDVLTAVDDATLKNEWGSTNIDDEGNPGQRNVLIENGVLKSYLVDKLNGRRMNAEPTGSGRRQSYAFAPTSRMSNTYIVPGKSTKDEIISSIDDGLYCAKMGGGSVNPITGEFNFLVSEGYLIKGGKIASPVRGASLIGKGHEVLFNIDMVGDNLAHAQGMCGSLSGSIPVNVGQPIIRVSEILVGGKS
ncbi:MAG: TldD/PmbA family protein [Eubacteriales bacterium]